MNYRTEALYNMSHHLLIMTSDPPVISCNFESGICGWTQARDDQFDWMRHRGTTATSNTGPTRDHTTGRESNLFLYLDKIRKKAFIFAFANFLKFNTCVFIKDQNNNFLLKVLPHQIKKKKKKNECSVYWFHKNVISLWKIVLVSMNDSTLRWHVLFTDGYYMFIEASSPRRAGDKARLVSPAISGNGTMCLNFWYHMYGAHINSLNVYVLRGSALGTPVWTKHGTQGNAWKQGQVQTNVQGQFSVSFVYILFYLCHWKAGDWGWN